MLRRPSGTEDYPERRSWPRAVASGQKTAHQRRDEDLVISAPAGYGTRLWLATNISARLAPTKMRPTDVSLKLTENCQARCVTCDYWKHRWKDHIDTDSAVHLINRLGEIGVTTLRFTGGEPLLRRDFFDILATIDATPFQTIGVQTNGLLFSASLIRSTPRPSPMYPSPWTPSGRPMMRSAASPVTSTKPSPASTSCRARPASSR
jgi:hypothetical protein